MVNNELSVQYMNDLMVPCGNLTVCYGKWSIYRSFTYILYIVIFNTRSYVKLPEGKYQCKEC